MLTRLACLCLFALPLALPAIGSESHPFSIHDMLAMSRVYDHQISPDGKQIVFVRRETDLEANRGRTDLWLLQTDGGNLRPLTSGNASEANPRWSTDGNSVYFLSSRSGSFQIWRIPMSGGEALQTTDLPLDVTSFAVAPDGKKLALSLEVFPGSTVQQTVSKIEENETKKTTGVIYEKLFIRHWDTWKDGRRSHLFAYSLKEKSLSPLMKEMDADCPTKPFGGPEDYTFTPDSRGIVFAARDVGRKEAWSTDFDLYHVSLDGNRPAKCLTEKNKAWDASPVFSPDGTTLAYLAMKRPGFESDRFRIVTRSWPTGEEKVITEDWDRSPSGLSWSADGRTLLATASNLGQRSLYEINPTTGAVKMLIEKGTVRGFAPAGDRIIFGMDHLNSPVEFYSTRADGGDTRRISTINDDRVNAARMGEAEQFTFEGWNKERVYCYVVKPVDFDPAKKYPVAFLIHGGPQGSFGNDFHYRWNPQAYTGAGYAAVMVDFHGSVGYGQEFTDSISGDWGGKPFEDLKLGLGAALERYSWMDGEKVCALGASYGGYMINWISGQWPERFTCFVNHDGNLDERLAYFDTEELWFPEWERGGAPWENPESYEKHNPINHVGKWKTPMLVVHGALDYRVVDTQGISTFTALQRRGIPSKFLYFPDENHWVQKPHNSILWHETVISWLDQWTKTGKH